MAHVARTPTRTAVEEVKMLISEMKKKDAVNKIARKYHMTEATLSRAYSNYKDDDHTEDKRFLLSADEEEVLLAYIMAQDASDLALDRKAIIDLVKRYKNGNPGWNSWRWWDSFRTRHEMFFSSRKDKVTQKNLPTYELVTQTQVFWTWYTRLIRKYNIPPRWILNADETPLVVDPKK